MKTVINPQNAFNIEQSAVALGTFDGLHKGHMALMEELSKSEGCTKAVLTFTDNPLNVSSCKKVKYIVPFACKEKLMSEAGVDIMAALEFDNTVKNTEAESFFDNYLKRILKAKKIIVGYNFSFGKDRKGTTEFLRQKCADEGIELCVIPPVVINGQPVSSTLIRERIKCCDFEAVKEMLGRCFEVSGEVIEGNRIGRTIGFPTANMNIDSGMVMPEDGVFITSVNIGGRDYPSVTNVGGKPTVQEGYNGLETHIIGFDGNLYGKTVTVRFHKRTRGITRFSDLDELKRSISNDRNKAVEYFESN